MPILTRFAALALLSAPAFAAFPTLLVPQQFASIQAAVDAATNGATIVIHSGTYEEAVLVDGLSNLHIQGKGKVVIDPPDGEDGLTLINCLDCTVQKIRVTGAIAGIAIVDSSGGVISKCRVEDVSGPGVVLAGCAGVTVDGCTILDVGEDGIVVTSTKSVPSVGCTLVGNHILGPGDEGIDVDGNENVVEKNLVKDAGGDGYRTEFDPPAVDNVFTGNRTIGATDAGFRVHGTHTTLTANKVISSGADGVSLAQGTGHVVEKCKIVKSFFDGIFGVEDVSGVVITGNKISKPGANGMDIDGDVPEVEGNKVSGAGANGYYIAGNDGTWTGNSAKGSGDDGFELVGTENTLTFNKAKGSQAGFDLNNPAPAFNDVDETNKFKTIGP